VVSSPRNTVSVSTSKGLVVAEKGQDDSSLEMRGVSHTVGLEKSDEFSLIINCWKAASIDPGAHEFR
jgi:hypothetical protein